MDVENMVNKYGVTQTKKEAHYKGTNVAKSAHNNGYNEPADFETAIAATGFGLFNIILILISIPSGWTAMFESSTMSYVFPAAQCDLDLSLDQKGSLNAITYLGMISSALLWGFLADTLGRQTLLSIGFMFVGVIEFMSAFSQSTTVLMIAKYLGGFIVSGPSAVHMAYLSEFHAAKYRARFQLILGTIFSAGTIILPLIAWCILPLNSKMTLFELGFHSWNLFLLLLSLPALLSAVIFTFLPESPKFLMTTGRNEEALDVLKRVFKINCMHRWNTVNEYPIKYLKDEIKSSEECDNGYHITAKRNKVQAIKEGIQQIKPLFCQPYLLKMILVCAIQAMIMMSVNTLRLWMPQIFQAQVDYLLLNNGSTASLCTMLETIRPKNSTECFFNTDNDSVYIDAMIVSLVAIMGYAVAGSCINIMGKKKLLLFLGTAGGLSAISIYFSQSKDVTLVLASMVIALGSIENNVLVTVIVDLFPTAYRTMTIALTLTCGRVGAMMGNLVFPFLLKTGCSPPFITMGTALIGSSLLSLLLPNTDMTAMK